MDQRTDPDPASTTDPPARAAWDTVLATTPVVLTVVGTLLAGLSSSEMTQAQYYRSLAAQNQSKAGDQWGFFQAKRIRGQNLEAGIRRFPVVARPGPVPPELLQAGAARLLQRLERAEKSVARLQLAGDQADSDLGPAASMLRQATAELSATAATDLRQAKQAFAALTQELAKTEVHAAFAYLGTGKLPEWKESPIEDPAINEVLKGIAERKPEAELTSAVLRIKENSLQQAIELVEGDARAFDQGVRPVDRALERLDQLVEEEVRQAASFHQATAKAEPALAAAPERTGKAVHELQAAGAAVVESESAVRAAAEELSALVTVVHFDFTARRYEREARYNQRLAGLFEVEVRRNSIASDRHRTRSKNFFYGMLFAQAGVTIASLALAGRRRSALWAIAGGAGLAAVMFSGYVYLYM